ncbi:UNVERIFIED_CONTAM: hypothetical protein H355_012638, partial [Colinus virginianus]
IVMAVWEDKIPLLTVCFQRILLLPSGQDVDISLYSKCFVKQFYSLKKTNLILVALQGMRDCSNYSTQVAATLMAVLTVDFKPTPTNVQWILTAIHRSRKLIMEEWAQSTIQSTFPWLATSDPRASTFSLLHCSPTCNRCAAPTPFLEGPPIHPHMDRDLHPLWIGTPMPCRREPPSHAERVAMALHKIVQHSQYGPHVRLFFPELFMVLIFQMVSSRELTSLEVTAIMEDPICPSTPTSAIRYSCHAHRRPHSTTRSEPTLSPDPMHAAPFPCRILLEDFQVAAYEEEAHTAFAVLDAVEGKSADALLALEAMKNLVSSWNLAEFLSKAVKKTVSSGDPPCDDVIIVEELAPTPERRALAGFLKLPSTSFCYKNKPGYIPGEEHVGKTELGRECAPTLVNQPAPGEMGAGQTPQAPFPSAGGISSTEDESLEDSQMEVNIQIMKE